MMNTEICKYKNQIPEYCEGFLDGADAEEMRAHVAECEQCKSEEAEYRRFSALIENTAESVPEELHGKIMSAVNMERRRERFARAIKRFALPACAALLLLVAAPTVIKNMQSNAPSEAYAGARYDGAQVPSENPSALSSDNYKDLDADLPQAPAPEEIMSSEATDVYVYEAKKGENEESLSFAVECPVVKVDKNVFETLSMSFADSVILTDGDGVLFKLSDALRLALVSNGATLDVSSEYVKVDLK